jgi:hemolysin activation/secretion protein
MKHAILITTLALFCAGLSSRGEDALPQNGIFTSDSGIGNAESPGMNPDGAGGRLKETQIRSGTTGGVPDDVSASVPTMTIADSGTPAPATGIFSESNSRATGTSGALTMTSPGAGGLSTGGPISAVTNGSQNGGTVTVAANDTDSDSALPQNGATTTASSPQPDSTAPVAQPGDITLTPENPVPINPLPPLPKLELNMPRQYQSVLPELRPSEGGALFGPQIYVKEFHFKGNHVYSSATLGQLLQKYTGRKITSDELEAARQIVTLYYVTHGYINSGAVLPDQDPKDGVILFQIVEGRLTQVEVIGQHWFQTWWLRNQMRQAAGNPLNFNDLKTGMQSLRENPNISQVNAELQPGGVPGESKLKMEVKDNMPFRFSVELNNYRPPSVGSTVAEVHASDLNLTGNNDPLTINYGVVNSTSNGFAYSHLDNAGADYRFPILPWGTTMEIGADRNNAGIIQEPFNELLITSKLTEYHLAVHQPVFDTPQRSLILSFEVDDRRNETALLGLPFSLSPGSINGVEQVFVPRFIQEFVDRSQVHVFSLRSQLSVGIGMFNSTINAGPPDGHFVDWLGQAQYIRRLGSSDNLVILRLNGQIADRPLLSLEQFELGGVSSVRGYVENQALRDNGIISSAEFRLPLLSDKDHNSLIALAPFTDFGVGWNNVEAYGAGPAAANNLGTQAVAMPSVGIGLLLNPCKYVNGQIYWGYGLNRKQEPNGHGLQYDGIEFSLVVTAF